MHQGGCKEEHWRRAGGALFLSVGHLYLADRGILGWVGLAEFLRVHMMCVLLIDGV